MHLIHVEQYQIDVLELMEARITDDRSDHEINIISLIYLGTILKTDIQVALCVT